MKLKELIEHGNEERDSNGEERDPVYVWAKTAYAALSTAQHAPIQFAAVAEALEAAEEEL
jgi:hypothetical protein